MRVDEFVIKLKSFSDALPEVRDKLIIDAVFASAGLAKRRVIGSRETHSGGIFGIYSPAYLKKRISAGKGSDPRINFSYTGKMWQSTQPVIVSSTDQEVRIRIAPLDSQRNKVMGYHDERFGEIIQLSAEEIEIIKDDFILGLQDLMNSTLL